MLKEGGIYRGKKGTYRENILHELKGECFEIIAPPAWKGTTFKGANSCCTFSESHRTNTPSRNNSSFTLMK